MACSLTEEEFENSCQQLNNEQEFPYRRFCSLVKLRYCNDERSRAALLHFVSNCKSVFFKCQTILRLGHMRMKEAIPLLVNLLEDKCEPTIVRHEAAEALGAIGDLSVKKTLCKYQNDTTVEIAETCHLALGRLKWLEEGGKDEENECGLIHPAPPLEGTIPGLKLKIMLEDKSLPLFERYRALYKLRDTNYAGARLMLISGLIDENVLLRHQTAFIFATLSDSSLGHTILQRALTNETEHEMVRVESALALAHGAIFGDDVLLERYMNHPNQLISECCTVGYALFYGTWNIRNKQHDNYSIGSSARVKLKLKHDLGPEGAYLFYGETPEWIADDSNEDNNDNNNNNNNNNNSAADSIIISDNHRINLRKRNSRISNDPDSSSPYDNNSDNSSDISDDYSANLGGFHLSYDAGYAYHEEGYCSDDDLHLTYTGEHVPYNGRISICGDHRNRDGDVVNYDNLEYHAGGRCSHYRSQSKTLSGRTNSNDMKMSKNEN